MTEITVKVPVLARVEGEGALEFSVRDGRVSDVALRIYEPPRFFEKLLQGRNFWEVPDIVARICGICPVAYQMSAVTALEAILGVDVGESIRLLRRLMYCGEWIESHALHLHLLAAPDFLGFDSVIGLAEEYPAEVRRGLRLQALGNRMIRMLGGRSVHPVGVCVGGFFRVPQAAELTALRDEVASALADAEALVTWIGSLPRPAMAQDFESVALMDARGYPFFGDRIVSDRGLDLPVAAFEREFAEVHVPQSTALHCLHRGAPYLVGPLARVNLNLDRLGTRARAAAVATGIDWPSRNTFDSVVARAVEIVQALETAETLLETFDGAGGPRLDSAPRGGIGFGATEAPRGMLWHRYDLDDSGHVTAARIVPPTSQNQAQIERDLAASLTAFGLDRGVEALRHYAETVVRSYDPCISCATHFLDLTIHRR